MRVRLLSPYPREVLLPLFDAIRSQDDECSCAEWEGHPADITVMWGWREVLRQPEELSRRIINIHISYLPWNRGSQPNLWSWYDDTPKGVTIHQVTKKVDAGPILAQQQIIFTEPGSTLRTTYAQLQALAVKLFCNHWADFRDYPLRPQAPLNGEGSYHTTVESMELMRHFPLGYDTPVMDIVKFGKEQRRGKSI